MINFTHSALTALLVTTLALQASAQSFNPTAPAHGFNVFTDSTITFSGNAGHAHGSVATGSNLILNGSYSICLSSSGTYPSNTLNNTAGGNYNYGLVVAGKIQYQSGQVSQVNNYSQLRIGDTTGTRLYDRDNNNNTCNLRAVATGVSFTNSSNYITIQNWNQSAASAYSSHGINFTSDFSSLKAYCNTINNYPVTHANSNSSFNFVSVPTGSGGTQNFNIVSGKINFINLTPALWATLQSNSSNTSYAISPSLSSVLASTVVIFNVQTAGNFNWVPLNIGGLAGSDGRQIIWNFTTSGTINITGSNAIRGTVFAPNATYTKSGSGDIDGQVIAHKATLDVGEIHYVTFTGTLPAGSSLAATSTGASNPNASTAVVLPIEYIDLNAAQESNGTRLQWNILSHGRLQSLSLQRSGDGQAFTDINPLEVPAADVPANGSYTDVKTTAISYYRLRAIDETGKLSYSNIAVVRGQADNAALSAYPNPFSNSVSIHAAGMADNQVSWSITDALGRSVLSGISQADASGGVSLTGLGSIPPGLYTLQCVAANTAFSVKLQKGF